MTTQFYPKGKGYALGFPSKVDFNADTIIAMLIHSATTPFNSAHEFISDLVAGGIVARSGGLAGKTGTLGTFDANDTTITSVSGASIDAIILAKSTGLDTTSPLIAWYDISPAIAPLGTDMTITWHASGILGISG